MSALLDTLAFLDAARRRDCEAHDAAMQLENAMRHGMRSASREFADLERNQSLDPSDEEFAGEASEHGTAARLEAIWQGFEKFGTGAVFRVEPAQQSGRAA